MATVDFTLEDVRGVVRDVVREEVPVIVAEIIEPMAVAIQADIQRLDGRISDLDQRMQQGFAEVNQRFKRFGQAAHELLVNGDERRN